MADLAKSGFEEKNQIRCDVEFAKLKRRFNSAGMSKAAGRKGGSASCQHSQWRMANASWSSAAFAHSALSRNHQNRK